MLMLKNWHVVTAVFLYGVVMSMFSAGCRGHLNAVEREMPDEQHVVAFDGDGAYLDLGVDAGDLGIEGNREKTVEIRVFMRDFQGNEGIFSLGSIYADLREFTLRTDGGNENEFVGQFWAGDVYFTHEAKNQWVHFAVTHDGESQRIYADGELVAEQDNELDTSTEHNLRVGFWSGAQETLDGRARELRVWNTSRTESEIREYMDESLEGDEDGLVGYWPMDEGTGESVRDLAGDNDGSFVNEPRWTLARGIKQGLEREEIISLGDTVTLGPIELFEPHGELSYQWYFNDEPIEGATESVLTISDITEDEMGTYYARIDDDERDISLQSRRSRVAEYEMRNWVLHGKPDREGAVVDHDGQNMVTVEFADGLVRTIRVHDFGDAHYYMFNVRSEFPEEVDRPGHIDGQELLVHLDPEDLEPGEENLSYWPNKGTLGGGFHAIDPIQKGPAVGEIDGRKGVDFYRPPYHLDLQGFPAMTSDFYVPESIDQNESFAVAAWLYQTGATRGQETFLAFQSEEIDGIRGLDGTLFSYGEGGRDADFGEGSGAFRGDVGATGFSDGFPATNQWQHIAWVYDAGEGLFSLYKNGRLIDESHDLGGGSNPGDEDKFFILGEEWGAPWGGRTDYHGHIGELRIYNEPISHTKVRNIYGRENAFRPSPEDGVEIDGLNAQLSWLPGVDEEEIEGYRVYLGTDYDEVREGTENVLLGQVEDVGISTGELALGQTYYWKVDQLNSGDDEVWSGDVWEFTADRGYASEPVPADNTEDLSMESQRLQWRPGPYAESQRLHLYAGPEMPEGTEADLVVDLDGDVGEYTVSEADFDYSRTYYWQVEQINEGDLPPSPGELWTFSVEDYFNLEYDGPTVEPFPEAIRHDGYYAYLEGDMHPVLYSDPEPPQDTLVTGLESTNRLLARRPDVKRTLAAYSGGTNISGNGAEWPGSEYTTASYGDVADLEADPDFYGGQIMLVHEMGHQIHMHGMEVEDIDFRHRLHDVYQTTNYAKRWTGDYATSNLWEYIAVAANWWVNDGHREDVTYARENYRKYDPDFYYLLKEYWPAQIYVALDASKEIEVDENSRVRRWHNNRGIEFWGWDGWDYYEDTVGYFTPVAGAPSQNTAKGVSSVRFDGEDALEWNLETRSTLGDNFAWTAEMWVAKDSFTGDEEVLLSWGPGDGEGIKFMWSEDDLAYYHHEESMGEWTEKPELGTFNHLVFAYEGGGMDDEAGTLSLYVNGERVKEVSQRFDMPEGHPIIVGGEKNGGEYGSFLEGDIAAVRIHDYELSDQQVAKYYDEKNFYFQQREEPEVSGLLLVDLDAGMLSPPPQMYPTKEWVRPFHPEATGRDWLRSWNNRGALGGRIHNDHNEDYPKMGEIDVSSDIEIVAGRTSEPMHVRVDGVDAVEFGGSERMVSSFTPAQNVTDTGTIEAWVYNEGGEEGTILQWGSLELGADMLPGAGQWHYVALSFDEGGVRVYVDGELVEESDVIEPELGETDRLHLGAWWTGEKWDDYYEGLIARVRIHTGILTESEIEDNHARSGLMQARNPDPAHEGRAVADRDPALSWDVSVEPKSAEYDVYLGTDRAAVRDAGKDSAVYQGGYASGEFVPELGEATRYYWRVDALDQDGDPIENGKVWSFETAGGLMVDLQADELEEGELDAWENQGNLAGSFTAEDYSELAFPEIDYEDGRRSVYFSSMQVLESSFETPEEITGTESFTVSMWAHISELSDSNTVLSWAHRPDNVAQFQYAANLEDGAWINQPGEKETYFVSGAPPYTYWNHLVWTYSGGPEGVLRIYVNGELSTEKEMDIEIDHEGEILLGATSDGAGSYLDTFCGWLDEVSIYEYALDVDEVGYLYQAEGREPEDGRRLVHLQVENFDEEGERWENTGTLEGYFAVPEDIRKVDAANLRVEDRANRRGVVFSGADSGYGIGGERIDRGTILVSDFITPDVLVKDNPFTAEMWVYGDEKGETETILNLAPYTNMQGWTQIATLFISANLNYGDGGERSTSAFNTGWDSKNVGWAGHAPESGGWHHLAWVYTGGYRGEMRLYVDGERVKTREHYHIHSRAGFPMRLGAAWHEVTGASNFFSGALNEVKIYDYVRSDEEIEGSAR